MKKSTKGKGSGDPLLEEIDKLSEEILSRDEHNKDELDELREVEKDLPYSKGRGKHKLEQRREDIKKGLYENKHEPRKVYLEEQQKNEREQGLSEYMNIVKDTLGERLGKKIEYTVLNDPNNEYHKRHIIHTKGLFPKELFEISISDTRNAGYGHPDVEITTDKKKAWAVEQTVKDVDEMFKTDYSKRIKK